MSSKWSICGERLALEDMVAGDMQNWEIGLLAADPALAASSCDETLITQPTWSGYAPQSPLPWGSVGTTVDGLRAYVDSAVMFFPVDSDPGSEVIYGWFAYDPAAPTNEQLRVYQVFDSPVTPVEGVPFVLVARVITKNCE